MYKPQVGDRVRRTYPDGTIVEGVIAHVGGMEYVWADSKTGFRLFDEDFVEQTELLDRPFKLNTAPGAVYGDPTGPARRVVRVGPDGGTPWLGKAPIGHIHWHTHEDIERLVRDHGWVEYNLDGSRKND